MYGIEFEYEATLMRVRLTGASRDLEATVDAWRRVAADVRERQPESLLVVSHVQGEPLSVEQIAAFVRSMRGFGLESLRIAYVYPTIAGWREVETAEILANEAGFEVRAFAEERAALTWLRHGER